jgi:hypothetical protein
LRAKALTKLEEVKALLTEAAALPPWHGGSLNFRGGWKAAIRSSHRNVASAPIADIKKFLERSTLGHSYTISFAPRIK